MPLVSIVMATYNRAGYVGGAIESVLAQTFKDWELIVVNDGSTDNTDEIVRPYCAKEPRICYVNQSNAGCLALVRNKGLSLATGKYVAFLDDDDRWLPHKLERQVALMESSPDLSFCYMLFQVYRRDGDQREATVVFPESFARTFEDLFRYFVPPSSVLVRKSHLDDVGPFDARYPVSEDFDMWLRLGQRSRFQGIDEIGAFTVMDDRSHEGADQIRVWKVTSRICRNLKLTGEYASRKRFVSLEIARRIYEIGRIYFDQGHYWKAALYFIKALWSDPLVGLAVCRDKEEGWELFLRVLKAYVAIPICLLKGLFGYEKHVD